MAESIFRMKSLKKALKKLGKNMLLGFLIFAFAFGGLIASPANVAEAALSQVSRNALGAVVTNPATGYPVWYQDVTGVALQQCLGINADGTGAADPKCILPGFATVPDINANPLGFPDESFYFFAEAPLVINGNAARFRLLLEGAFDTPVPTPGHQIVFTRASFFTNQQNTLPINGTFHVEYPFGSFNFTTDAFGDMVSSSPVAPFQSKGKEIRAEDGPGAALDFVTVLAGTNTGITTFLKSTTAPAGYLGDAVTETPVTGGTNGNFFALTGSGFDPVTGAVVPIDIFQSNWVVAGKIAVIDTVAPVIGATSPASVPVGTVNAVASVNVTDNLGATRVTVDLGPLGNDLAATLNGAQSVPPSTSTATGTGTFVIDTTANTLSFNVNATGLTGGPIQSIHIHGPAVAGVNGPMLFNMGNTLPAIGVWNYPETAEADILAGKTYVNVHTPIFSDLGDRAEIRGQILPLPNIQNMILAAGTKTDGTWGTLIPSATRLGTFNLPLAATDGSNTATGTLTLTVNRLTSVNVTPPAASIAVLGTQQLTASPIDNNGAPFTGATITWASSNNGVATVSATGLVAAVAPGTATITATALGGGVTVIGTSAITVTSAAQVLTSIVVTPATATVAQGGTRQLTAQALDQVGAPMIPQPVFTWTSGNELIATVSTTGLVTGVAVGGPVTITATSGLISGTSAVTVSAAAVCQTTADTDLNGAISNLEILNHVRSWKAGTVSNLEILQAVRFWKAGTGC